MDSSKLVLFLSPIFFHLIWVSMGQPEFILQNCANIGNYSVNSTYQKTLNRLLSALPSNASIRGFSNSSAGVSPDRVTALALCRGDVDTAACRSCLDDAVRKLPQICPNQKQAFGWYDNCLVRYSNQSIMDVADTTIWLVVRDTANTSSDLDHFDTVLGDLMVQLRTRAAAGGSARKFAAGEANLTSFERIYGLVQCTPDLSQMSCINCLENAIKRIPDCCAGNRAVKLVCASCMMRFGPDLFYTPTTETAPAPPPLSPPSTNTTTTPPPGTLMPFCTFKIALCDEL